jgi:hypothetical protein
MKKSLINIMLPIALTILISGCNKNDDSLNAMAEAQEIRNQLRSPQEQKEAQEEMEIENGKNRFNSEFPFYAVISCGIGAGHVNIMSCFSGSRGALEIKNGNEYGLYKIMQISNKMVPNSENSKNGLIVNLRKGFEIEATSDGGNNMILGIKILDRVTGQILFEKQVGNLDFIMVRH